MRYLPSMHPLVFDFIQSGIVEDPFSASALRLYSLSTPSLDPIPFRKPRSVEEVPLSLPPFIGGVHPTYCFPVLTRSPSILRQKGLKVLLLEGPLGLPTSAPSPVILGR